MMESSISISTSSINQHAGRLTNISATATASITNDNSNTNNVASCTPSNNKKPKKASPKQNKYTAKYYEQNKDEINLKRRRKYQQKKDEENKKKLEIAETIRITGKNHVYIEESQKFKEEMIKKQHQQKQQQDEIPKVVLQPPSPIRSFSIPNVLEIAPDLEAPVRRVLHRQMMEELVITVDAKKGNSDRLNTEFPSTMVHYRGAPTGTSDETYTYEERFAYATETARGTKGICKT